MCLYLPELLDVAHSSGEIMVLQALQNGLHRRLGGGETGDGHGGVRVAESQVFVFEFAGHRCLRCLQAGLQIRELSRHVQQLQSGRRHGGIFSFSVVKEGTCAVWFNSQDFPKKPAVFDCVFTSYQQPVKALCKKCYFANVEGLDV